MSEVPPSAIVVTSPGRAFIWLRVLVVAQCISALLITASAVVYWRIWNSIEARAVESAEAAAAAVSAADGVEAVGPAFQVSGAVAAIAFGYFWGQVCKMWCAFLILMAMAMAGSAWYMQRTRQFLPELNYAWSAIMAAMGMWGVVFYRLFGALILAPAALSSPASLTMTHVNLSHALALVTALWLLAHAALTIIGMSQRGPRDWMHEQKGT